MIAYDLYLVTY